MIVCESLSDPVNVSLVLSPVPSPVVTVGTTATYQCNPGYVLVGNITRTCEDSGNGTLGTWTTGSGIDPICEHKH